MLPVCPVSCNARSTPALNINDYKVGDVITVNTNVSELYDYEETTYPSIYFLALANYSGDSCEWGNTPTVITINE